MMFISTLSTMLLMLLSNQSQAMMDSTMDSTTESVITLIVSTVLGKENSNPTGSIVGGTTLYMQVQGLDQTASNIAVYIGKYPCIISDKGVNGLFMNCKTTKPDPNDNNLSILQNCCQGMGQTRLCIGYSHFTYTQYYTPKLFYVSPRSNYPRTLSYWRAKWAVPSSVVQQSEGQFMGANRCDRFTVQDLYPDEINFWDDQVVCQVSAEIKAGYYDYTIKSQSGYQTNNVGVKQKRVYSDRTYNSKLLPIITEINTNVASPEGQILQISGYGFSPIASENTVKISGYLNLFKYYHQHQPPQMLRYKNQVVYQLLLMLLIVLFIFREVDYIILDGMSPV